MFFAPPKVKAISRYADFGSHLGVGSFGVMLGVAVLIHAIVIGIYAMAPHGKVVKIPVRVLNINLGMPISDRVPASEQPVLSNETATRAAEKHEPKVVAEEPSPEPKPAEKISHKELQDTPENELDKALAGAAGVTKEKTELYASANKKSKKRNAVEKKEEQAAAKKGHSPFDALSLEVPKRYVRERVGDNSGNAGAEKPLTLMKPKEVAQRYEQVLGLWIRQHQIYPEDLKRRHIEGDVVMRVRINRQGRVLYYVVDKSSGNAFLDRAAMDMVRASDPAPPVPDNYPEGDELDFLEVLSFRVEK